MWSDIALWANPEEHLWVLGVRFQQASLVVGVAL
jgi:hypothetical protein